MRVLPARIKAMGWLGNVRPDGENRKKCRIQGKKAGFDALSVQE
jgi:hypothetical protein